MVLAKAVLAEFLGSFIFFSVILSVVANPTIGSIGPIAISVGLLTAIYFGGSISGGHFNPAVSLMMLVKGNITSDVFFLYILAQVFGGLIAVAVNNYFIA
jgi:aquaporin Z